jgi:hypothetical protein
MRRILPAGFLFASMAYVVVACSGSEGGGGTPTEDAAVDGATEPDGGTNGDGAVKTDGATTDGGKPVVDAGDPCGAGKPRFCKDGEGCAADGDCTGKNCASGVCTAAKCDDKKQDGDEVGIDCGGSCPVKCDGAACGGDAECKSNICFNSTCAPLGTKTCGIGLPTPCENGKDCAQDADCATNYCTAAKCAAVDAAAHQDGRANAGETGVDCGGVIAATTPCAAGQGCTVDADCTGLCNANQKCDAPSADDGKKNNGETDVDCGGANAPKCAPTQACAVAADCFGGICTNNACVAPSHGDGIKNANETDVDCGGTAYVVGPINLPAAGGCNDGKTCAADKDCKTNACDPTTLKCVTARSCRTTSKAGIATCGAGEATTAGVPAGTNESCCVSLPLPSTPAVRMDKYEITAGRMRQFVSEVGTLKDANNVAYGANIAKWAADQITANNAVGQSLSAQIPAGIRDLLPASAAANAALNSVIQLGATSVDSRTPSGYQGCYAGPGAYGHSTYWQPNATLNAAVGYTRAYGQNVLDQKSMNCAPYWLFAAFCAWDGGQLPTMTQVADAWGAAQYPWGANALTYDTVGRPSAVATTVNWGNGLENGRFYAWPNFPGAVDTDTSVYIAAPGRFLMDVTSTKSLGQGWQDLGANLLEWTQTSGSCAGRKGCNEFCDYTGTGGGATDPICNYNDPQGTPKTGVIRKNAVMPAYAVVGGSWEGHQSFGKVVNGLNTYDWTATNKAFFRAYPNNNPAYFPAQTQYGKFGARCVRPAN